MLNLCKMQTVRTVDGRRTVAWEEFVLCSSCVAVVDPEFVYPTVQNNICVRCGIKNFRREDTANEV